MTTSRLTLAQQLAQLEDPNPIDIDPEDEYNGKITNGDELEISEEDNFAKNTGHYLPVERSSLRKLHESLNDPKYAGKRINRGLGEDASSNSGGEELATEDSSDSMENVSQDANSQSSESESEEHEDEDDQVDENEEMNTNHSSTREPQEDLDNSLKRARDADRLKGQAVAKQLAIWDAVVDARIRLQKSISLCNTLPFESKATSLRSHEDGEKAVHEFLREALLLSADILEAQEALVQAGIGPSDGNQVNIPPRKKRKLEASGTEVTIELLESELASASSDLAKFQHAYHPYTISTLQKWSSKIQAVTASSLLPSSRNAFRTNRNAHLKSVVEIIEETLSDRPRAVARTRIRRGPPRIDSTSSTDANPSVDVEGKPLDTEESDLFDDADFYQQLLRDVIANKTAQGHDGDELNTRPKKVKKVVDTRASKGRKLRYEVHEKLQNFMVPVPTIVEGWHEEKINELFASLLGHNRQLSKAQVEDERENIAVKLPKDGFKVFG